MEEILNRQKELELLKKQAEQLDRKYCQGYKKMLIDFLKTSGLDKYVQIEDSVGILKVDKEPTLGFPYVIKFYPLRDDGVPSMKAEHFHCLVNNDFNEILENVKSVEIEFKK